MFEPAGNLQEIKRAVAVAQFVIRLRNAGINSELAIRR